MERSQERSVCQHTSDSARVTVLDPIWANKGVATSPHHQLCPTCKSQWLDIPRGACSSPPHTAMCSAGPTHSSQHQSNSRMMLLLIHVARVRGSRAFRHLRLRLLSHKRGDSAARSCCFASGSQHAAKRNRWHWRGPPTTRAGRETRRLRARAPRRREKKSLGGTRRATA